ncbi:MAG TPA: Clp protease N-terminal domain-containing protein [Amycolatopsis sp.]|nr:Clp protease N-terminal domain-containing protein [Amycolatopsis sp.]
MEEEVVRRVGLGGGAALFGGLDRDALAAVGVDLDAVRARIVTSFDADALACAAGRREPHRNRRRLHRVIPSVLFRRKRRRALVASAIGPAATGRFRAEGAPSRAHLPFTTAAREVLADGVREAQSLRDGYIGVEHLALGLIRTDGLVKPILHALGTSAPAVRAELLDRYGKAG